MLVGKAAKTSTFVMIQQLTGLNSRLKGNVHVRGFCDPYGALELLRWWRRRRRRALTHGFILKMIKLKLHLNSNQPFKLTILMLLIY